MWHGTGGVGKWLPPSRPFPTRGEAWVPSLGRETCLYVCPPGNVASSSASSPQGKDQDAHPPWVPCTNQRDEGWEWQSLGLHEEELRGFWDQGFWVTSCHPLPPPRCRTYGSLPVARLQPRTLYNASWSSPATQLTPSPQNPAPSKRPWKQHPRKRPPQWKESKNPSKANTTALQGPMTSPRPDMAPTGGPHPGLQGPWGGLKPQGELRT